MIKNTIKILFNDFKVYNNKNAFYKPLNVPKFPYLLNTCIQLVQHFLLINLLTEPVYAEFL